MRELLPQIVECLAAGRPAALCRLVETRGSTPQKAGAAMLVYADGSQAGTLGGGCVEAEVKRRALAAIGEGGAPPQSPRIETFQLNSDYGWDDGLICGGRMKVLILPLAGEAVAAYFDRMAVLVSEGRGATEAVVLDGAAGLPAGAVLLLDDESRLVAEMSAAAIDTSPGDPGDGESQNGDGKDSRRDIAAGVRPLADRPGAYVESGVAYLPLLGRCRLVIVGAGHVGQAVAELAARLDFEVWVVDDRGDLACRERIPAAERFVVGQVEQVLPDLPITPQTYCLIVTRGHNQDERALYFLAERGAAYVGLIGSRRKIRLIFEDLLAEGISPAALEHVHAPVGIDIGSQTVPEIAVSIAAELVARRNLGAVPGRPRGVAVGAGM